MKQTIHPPFFEDAIVTCSCGATFTTGSTKQAIRVDVCSSCHPLYTGETRFIDTLGQVGKFEQKQKTAQTYKAQISDRKKKDRLKQQTHTKSLRELMMEM